VGADPDVFTVRDGGGGLAQRLAAAGYEVERVDPWLGSAAEERGFDAVVNETYPQLVAWLQRRGPVIWIGHGLCGLLPVAAAAGADPPELGGWAALGTRMDYRFEPPAVHRWLSSWETDGVPDTGTVQACQLTGVADEPRRGCSARLDVMELHRQRVERRPPPAVLEDLQRWYATGEVTSRDGAVHYLDGLARSGGPVLLVAGVSDPMAPPEDVLPALEQLPGAAHYRMLSRINGHCEEFGHMGMLLSRSARRGLDRVLLAWLDGRERLP
jgi:lysosomal acid lipase/cholesteryl ester hydrolase